MRWKNYCVCVTPSRWLPSSTWPRLALCAAYCLARDRLVISLARCKTQREYSKLTEPRLS